MMSNNVTKKIKASLIHLLISAVLVSIILISIKVLSYPGVFFSILGAERLFKLIFFVDIILGPLLTFVIYSDSKKGLKFDLSVIAFCQIVAMVYGAYSLYIARPAYVVYVVDRFELVQQSQLNSPTKVPNVNTPQFNNLVVLQAKLPTSPEENTAFMEARMSGGPELAHSTQLYGPIDEASDLIRNTIKPLSNISESQLISLSSALNKKGIEKSSYSEFGLIPFTSSNRDFTALVRITTLSIEEIIEIDPWAFIDD